MESAHIRDGVAVCRYLAWLEKELREGRKVTEISGADKLAEFRQELSDFIGLSFETISSSGPNAAIIHYKPSAQTDREITDKEIYLCDSGAHYR